MFKEAYEIASQFTHPVIVSVRFFDKTVDCILGAFVALNDEGWIITVAHLLQPFLDFNQHAREMSEHKEQERKINADPSLNGKQRQKRIAHLKTNPKWITNISFWWAKDVHKITGFHLLPEGDLAICIFRSNPATIPDEIGHPSGANRPPRRAG